MTYEQFLQTKIKKLEDSGFECKELNPALFDFQEHIVRLALKKGRYALFENCGLGKTIQQLVWAHEVTKYTHRPVLILCPLAVSAQTILEGMKFHIEVQRWHEELNKLSAIGERIYITNYEQLEKIDCEVFAGIVLDESSILKNFTGVYKNLIIDKFRNTPYKLACTATPSPNDLNEIGNHSEFLNVLDAQDMRSKWFVRDEGMNNYRLKQHAKIDFYAWISSWACMITDPSDIGFDGSNFVLPKLNYIERHLHTKARDNGKLFNDASINATNFNAELRFTKIERLSQVVDIVNSSLDQFIVWVKQNEEADYLMKLIPDAVEVRGNDNTIKEKRLMGFAAGEFRVLITKSKIAQFGLNFQNCHNQIFASLDFSFESLYQSIRRSYRFGQTKEVNIYLITTDTMQNVINSIKEKERQFLEMQEEMNKNINSKQYGLLNDYDYKEVKIENALLMKGDSCREIKRIPDNSVDLIIYSPPFSSLFTYSNYIHDMGNNDSHDEFFKQYAFLLKDLYRILKPGRLMCCHTKNLGVYKNSSGYTGVYPFTLEHTMAVLKEGFVQHCDPITIWTDPVLEMQRTKTQRLLYKTVTSDSSFTGVGMSEYVTVFRKWEGDQVDWEPITNLTKKNFPLDTWQKWASGVWMDIRRTDVLNGHEGTDTGDEKHIAPLQLEVIHRLVNLYSNKGEVVFTPFLGIGSEVYQAIKDGRNGIGIELKDSYFEVAVKNCKAAELKKIQIEMFV